MKAIGGSLNIYMEHLSSIVKSNNSVHYCFIYILTVCLEAQTLKYVKREF